MSPSPVLPGNDVSGLCFFLKSAGSFSSSPFSKKFLPRWGLGELRLQSADCGRSYEKRGTELTMVKRREDEALTVKPHFSPSKLYVRMDDPMLKGNYCIAIPRGNYKTTRLVSEFITLFGFLPNL